jgi:hypothetical protein
MRMCIAVGLLAVTLAGCGTSAPPAGSKAGDAPHDHDHGHDHGHGHGGHRHPETLAEAVGELESLVAAVGEHLAAGSRDAADTAVHAVGHLLEDVEGLLERSSLVANAKSAAKLAVEELYECFDKLDTALHAKEGEGESPADVHASVVERVKAAVEALKGAK